MSSLQEGGAGGAWQWEVGDVGGGRVTMAAVAVSPASLSITGRGGTTTSLPHAAWTKHLIHGGRIRCHILRRFNPVAL